MIFTVLILSILTGSSMLPQTDKYSSLRERMVKDQIIDRGISDKATLRAMRKVPRHLFVPADVRDDSYDDNPLPIGHGQTISQPYIVAYMTEVSRPTPEKKCLKLVQDQDTRLLFWQK